MTTPLYTFITDSQAKINLQWLGYGPSTERLGESKSLKLLLEILWKSYRGLQNTVQYALLDESSSLKNFESLFTDKFSIDDTLWQCVLSLQISEKCESPVHCAPHNPVQVCWQRNHQAGKVSTKNVLLSKQNAKFPCPGLDKSQMLAIRTTCTSVLQVCPKLFWTCPKFSQWSNEPWKCSITLAHWASDCNEICLPNWKVY